MNDWSPVITAIAIQIPVLVGLLAFYVNWKIAESKATYDRQRTIDQNKDIIREQYDVKVALNGTTHLIPKIDRTVIEVKDSVKDLRTDIKLAAGVNNDPVQSVDRLPRLQ